MGKIRDFIKDEEVRQRSTIPLIASENIAYPEVQEAMGSVLMNKYAEGYPGRRYYQGNKIIDEIESYTQELGKKLFGLAQINVQSYSGSPANTAVMLALLKPGEKIAGMKLSAGGHLSHGHSVSISGLFFNAVQWDVDEQGKIDKVEVEKLLRTEKPKLIMVGTTAYPWQLDFGWFAKIGHEIGATVVADISHISGLVATGMHPGIQDVDIVVSTTHKMLRGPRGAFIGVTKTGVARNPELAKKIDRAVFPGLQGGPHMETVAAMGIAFEKALQSEFKLYCEQILKNAKVLEQELRAGGLTVYGTENHLMVVDVGFEKGKEVAAKLEEEGIIVNANNIPHDKASPFNPSGIRIGTPAVTALGMREEEMKDIAKRIIEVVY